MEKFIIPNDYHSELNLHDTQIAIKTVKEYLKNETSIKKVIFNVFKDEDRDIYERYLR